jgi:hypothetical protein
MAVCWWVAVAVGSHLGFVRHEAHCRIARGAGAEWRRCLWA